MDPRQTTDDADQFLKQVLIDGPIWDLVGDLVETGAFHLIHFHHHSETKRTQRFEEHAPPGVESAIQTLYLRKWFLDRHTTTGQNPPDGVFVLVGLVDKSDPDAECFE